MNLILPMLINSLERMLCDVFFVNLEEAEPCNPKWPYRTQIGNSLDPKSCHWPTSTRLDIVRSKLAIIVHEILGL